MKILMIGCGNMGFSMLSAWLTSSHLQPGDVVVVEPSAANAERAAKTGVRVVGEAGAVEKGFRPDLIVLAVKPQLMGEVLPGLTGWKETGAVWTSIAAGLTIGFYASILGGDVPIVRIMPNTPASIGKGAIAMIGNDEVSEDDLSAIETLLSKNGVVARLENEGQMDAVTALSGSGPAYVFHFIEAMRKAGTELGLPADLAALLADNTILGAALLATGEDADPADLRRQVTSPGGTTEQGLAVLMEDDRLVRLVTDAAKAAARRSAELSG